MNQKIRSYGIGLGLFAAAAVLFHGFLSAPGSFGDPGPREDLKLVEQSYEKPEYFWGRPFFQPKEPVSPRSLGSTDRDEIADLSQARQRTLSALDPHNASPVPEELWKISEETTDLSISRQAALYQVPRVARTRRLAETRVLKLVERSQDPPFPFRFGQARVNVLKLNLALDAEKN